MLSADVGAEQYKYYQAYADQLRLMLRSLHIYISIVRIFLEVHVELHRYLPEGLLRHIRIHTVAITEV